MVSVVEGTATFDKDAPGDPRRYIRVGVLTLALVALLAAVASGAVFARWVEVDNSIYFAAVETGQSPVYPANQLVYGMVIGSTVLFVTLVAVLGWLAMVAHQIPIRSWAQAIFLVSGSLLIGTSIPIFIQYVSLGLVPLIAGTSLLVVLSQQHRSRRAEGL